MLSAFIQCCRPLNGLMALLATLGGALVVLGPAAWRSMPCWLAACATLLALSAGNLWNDLADQREDAINRPARPLPSGRLSRRAAQLGSALLGLGALVAAVCLSWSALLWVALCLAALGGYAWKGKQVGVLGNLLVAALGAAAVGLGALAAHVAQPGAAKPWLALTPALLAGLLHLAREVVKDVEDLPGDQAAGRRSFSLRHGLKSTRALLRGVACCSPVPPALALLEGAAAGPLVLAHAVALGLGLLFAFRMWRVELADPARVTALARIIKGFLAIGLALYVAAATLS